MRYALIGCGRISSNHIMAAKENGLEIVALCDINLNQAIIQRQKYYLSESIPLYTDYHEMIKKSHPDLCAIATESGSHAKIAIDCIKAGCHVMIEKPIALSLQEADTIIEEAKANKVIVSVCHQNRFNQSVQALRKALEENRFGKLNYGVASIRWNRGRDYYQQASWRGTWRQDGGAIMNQCIHNIDLLLWMMGGEVKQVIARTDNRTHPYIEAEDLGLALIEFMNGSYGIVEGSTSIYPDNLEETLCIFGNKGTVKLGGKSVNLIEEWRFEEPFLDETEVKRKNSDYPSNIYGFGHSALYHDVIDAINKRREPYITAMDGRRALEMVLGIYQAAVSKKCVSFPIENTASTVDFEGRFTSQGE